MPTCGAKKRETKSQSSPGAVTMTGPALQALCWAERPVAHFTAGGWFAGLTTGMGLKNVFLRIEQVRRAGLEGQNAA